VVGGWIFSWGRALTFLVALIPLSLACSAMVWSPCPHRRPARVAPGPSQRGSKRLLAAAWLGTISACSLLGLIGGVFPGLGRTLGVGPSLFGVLLAGAALGRTLVFLLGFRWGRWVRDWRSAALAQIVASAMVGTLAFASRAWWLAVVFGVAGVAMGVCYYRGLYQTLEAPGSRGRKSGVFEASVLGGILLGTLGGGWIADRYGLRAPYVPLGLGCVLLALVQIGLVVSATKAQRAPDAPGA
jgi:MFS family permease